MLANILILIIILISIFSLCIYAQSIYKNYKASLFDKIIVIIGVLAMYERGTTRMVEFVTENIK